MNFGSSYALCAYFFIRSRQVLKRLFMKFSILRQSRGKKRKASVFHSRGNERPTERGIVPSVNRPTLQSASLLFSPISYKQHILLPWVGTLTLCLSWSSRVYLQSAIQYIRFGGEKQHRLKFIIQCLVHVREYPACVCQTGSTIVVIFYSEKCIFF